MGVYLSMRNIGERSTKVMIMSDWAYQVEGMEASLLIKVS